MSAKWHRSRAWDDRHFPPAMWPVKGIVRAFSSIWLAVILLSLVIVYATLASVPIGMLSQAPTWAIYGVAALLMLAVVIGIPTWLFLRVTRAQSRAIRFAGTMLLVIALLPVAGWFWMTFAWPRLHHDPASDRGFLLFADFCDRYRATTLRRLPGMEMTELEFYAWWPLRVVLLAFVLNMVTATLRRIEFSFKNLGVLTVHSGIVTIALGSIYYGGLKKEGDTLLIAGQPGRDGSPTPGPAQNAFYDNTLLSLFVGQQLGFEQRPLVGVPRYNDYNLAAFSGESALEAAHRQLPWKEKADPAALSRMLDIPVADSPLGIVDPDIKFRLVGYASYAEPARDWMRVDVSAMSSVPPAFAPNPLRILYLLDDRPDKDGKVSDTPVFSFALLPSSPASRLSELGGQLAIEYTAGMSDQRWSDLSEPLAPGTQHAIIAEIPASENGGGGEKKVITVEANRLPVKLAVGAFELEVQQLLPQPPFPIITEGYRGASSSVAVVRVAKPTDPAFKPFTRYIYHRYPEINQDMLDEVNDRGMPVRKDPDASIRLSYLDTSQIQIYIDEQRDAAGKPPHMRALIRADGGAVRLIDDIGGDGLIKDFVPKLSLRLGDRWDHAEAIDRPDPVESERQDRSLIGTHDKSLLAVEISSTSLKDNKGQFWKTILWLPFTRYLGAGLDTERDVFLPDGRMVRLAFGRRQHELPGFNIRLLDFQMIAYDHRGAPRDYQSMVRVEPTSGMTFTGFDHITKLNEPLTAPFRWSDDRSWASNFFGRLASGVNPHQFKFSQAGWDQAGWQKTQQQADAGLLPRPFAAFTILGVGNNPGIHMIAAGGVMMGLGIPWAFYFKPYLVRREKRKIQEQLAAGTYVRPTRPSAASPAAAPVPEPVSARS